MKKYLSIIIAALMLFSLPVVSFAEETTAEAVELTDIEGVTFSASEYGVSRGNMWEREAAALFKAFDNNESTASRIKESSDGAWYQINLPAPAKISEVTVVIHATTDFSAGAQVLLSKDGNYNDTSNGNTVNLGSFSAGTTRTITVPDAYKDVKYSYIRIKKSRNGNPFGFKEIYVKGYPDEADLTAPDGVEPRVLSTISGVLLSSSAGSCSGIVNDGMTDTSATTNYAGGEVDAEGGAWVSMRLPYPARLTEIKASVNMTQVNYGLYIEAYNSQNSGTYEVLSYQKPESGKQEITYTVKNAREYDCIRIRKGLNELQVYEIIVSGYAVAPELTAECNIANGATNVSNPNLTENVTVTFNQAMDSSTLNGNYVKLTGLYDTVGQYTVSADKRSISYDMKNLCPNKEYTLTLKTGLKNSSGTALDADTVLARFTTGKIHVDNDGENTTIKNISHGKTITSADNNTAINKTVDSYTGERNDGSDKDGDGRVTLTIDLAGSYVPKAFDLVLHNGYGGFSGWKIYGHNTQTTDFSDMTLIGNTDEHSVTLLSGIAKYRIPLDNDEAFKYVTISRSGSFYIYEATVWGHEYIDEDTPIIPEEPIEPDEPTSEELKIVKTVEEAEERSNMGTPSNSANGYKILYCKSGAYVTWNIDIPSDGTYLISAFAAFKGDAKPTFATYVDTGDGLGFVQMKEQEVKQGATLYTAVENPVCVMPLKAGTIKIKVLETYYELFLSDISVSAYEDFVLSGVKAGETKVDNGDIIERSTDCFELTFNRDIDGDTASKVKLVNNETGVSLKSQAETENNILRLYLNETLDYDSEYSLVLDGISDVYGVYQINETFASYKTSSEDGDVFSSMGISDEKISIDYNKTEITGTALSSQGKAICGRKVDAYLKDTKGAVSSEAVATCISGDGGAFKLNYTIPEESDSGLYTFILKAEYADSQTEVSVIYVSGTINEEITDALEATKDFNDVAGVVDTYKTILDINPAEDLKGIADKDSFYNHFAGKAYVSFDDFLTDYYNMIVFETVNQTTDTKVVDGILKSEESCKRLGADKYSTDRIISGRESFLKALVDLKAYTEHSDYMVEFNMLLNEYLSREFNKEKPVILAESVSVYSGQGIPVKLAFEKEVTDVSEFEFRLKSLDGAELILNPSVVLDIKGEYDVEVKDDTLIITVSAGTILTKAKDIGELYLASPENTGTYDFTLSASVTHRVADKAEDGSKIWYEAENKADDKNITATVTASSQGSQGSGSSVIPSGGKKPSSSGTAGGFTPVVTPVPDDTKYSFSDLPAGHWAEESINALVEKGIISKPENRIYNPDKLISREEFIKLVVVAFDMWNKDIQDDSFSDVTIDNWYYSYVYSAKQSGIITGDGNGAFGAGSAITREDMAVIIKRVMELKNIFATNSSDDTFIDDGEIAEYAKPAVYAMKNAGIINGVGGNAFEPKTGATRAMAAKVIYYLTKIIAN